ncbi:hypothetical protein BABINDRAFT_161227 [Babjeviella inositovora NRRL Y-12698]|uniref:Uncharacterized protein n=1 Tax=Babjeviella inositovora NRRL Y-12698 TaxID=984486 RepID=A0A1E3QRD5_9ASCO|nr:uncharacterized protein BABINDRAFT_161227 [Babjeviella inositovora NRRL Y-12698]ODQ80263.1 hypothetical protein BABINDRAFT_161227 [Babjeviella inositovora NRRL Y-12698]
MAEVYQASDQTPCNQHCLVTSKDFVKLHSSWPNGHGVWLRFVTTSGTRRFQVRLLVGKLSFLYPGERPTPDNTVAT